MRGGGPSKYGRNGSEHAMIYVGRSVPEVKGDSNDG